MVPCPREDETYLWDFMEAVLLLLRHHTMCDIELAVRLMQLDLNINIAPKKNAQNISQPEMYPQ